MVALFESPCPMAFYYVAKFIRKINYTCIHTHSLCPIADPLINILQHEQHVSKLCDVNKNPIYISNFSDSTAEKKTHTDSIDQQYPHLTEYFIPNFEHTFLHRSKKKIIKITNALKCGIQTLFIPNSSTLSS